MDARARASFFSKLIQDFLAKNLLLNTPLSLLSGVNETRQKKLSGLFLF